MTLHFAQDMVFDMFFSGENGFEWWNKLIPKCLSLEWYLFGGQSTFLGFGEYQTVSGHF